jgi:ABC-type methionine transport system permease subunit
VGVVISFLLGAAIGGAAGYFGGTLDNIVMRVIEFIRSIPTLPLWLALAAALPREWGALPTYIAVTVILSLLGWTWLARTVRSKLLATRHEDFVLAARLSGCSDYRIIRRHLLPSFLSYLIVDTSIAFPEILLAGDLAVVPRPWPARAGGKLGRAAVRGPEHPLGRPGAVADDPRHFRDRGGAGVQFRRRWIARCGRSLFAVRG